MKNYSDADLEAKITELQDAIQAWAERNEVWHDSGFMSYALRTNAEPMSPAVVTVLYSDGTLREVIDGSSYDELNVEFCALLEELGYEFENQDGCSFHIYVTNEELNQAFEEYFYWNWISSLVEPDFADIYEELYGYFHQRPDALYKLTPRQYEIILSRIFRTQGFEPVLGPGTGDGGVDIRLIQRDPLGDVLTLVQAKRYAKRKIDLGPVQALRGVMAAEGVANGIVITTSDYLPSSREFAANCRANLELKTSKDVAQWCEVASQAVIRDKSSLVSRANVETIVMDLALKLDPRLVHASFGYNMQINSFAIVLKETKYAALLMSIPCTKMQVAPYGQMGTEVPMLDTLTLERHAEPHVRRAKINDKSGKRSYWDGKHLYSPWDGTPQHFNYMD